MSDFLNLTTELKKDWSNHPNFKHMMAYADCPISMFWWDEVPSDVPTEKYGIEIQHIKHGRTMVLLEYEKKGETTKSHTK